MKLGSNSIIALLGIAFVLPTLAGAADVAVGRVEYERHCLLCHGATGKGNGWLAWFLKEPIRSLTHLTKDNGGTFPAEHVRQVIDGRKEVELHGPRDMPVWGRVYFARALSEPGEPGPRYGAQDDDRFVQSKILALIEYISSLQE